MTISNLELLLQTLETLAFSGEGTGSDTSAVSQLIGSPSVFRVQDTSVVSRSKQKDKDQSGPVSISDKGTTRGRTQIFQWKLSGLLVLDLVWFLVTSNPAKNFSEFLKINFENWQNLRKFCIVAPIVLQTYLYCCLNLKDIKSRRQIL